jgi:hypothetical protein
MSTRFRAAWEEFEPVPQRGAYTIKRYRGLPDHRDAITVGISIEGNTAYLQIPRRLFSRSALRVDPTHLATRAESEITAMILAVADPAGSGLPS